MHPFSKSHIRCIETTSVRHSSQPDRLLPLQCRPHRHRRGRPPANGYPRNVMATPTREEEKKTPPPFSIVVGSSSPLLAHLQIRRRTDNYRHRLLWLPCARMGQSLGRLFHVRRKGTQLFLFPTYHHLCRLQHFDTLQQAAPLWLALLCNLCRSRVRH